MTVKKAVEIITGLLQVNMSFAACTQQFSTVETYKSQATQMFVEHEKLPKISVQVVKMKCSYDADKKAFTGWWNMNVRKAFLM